MSLYGPYNKDDPDAVLSYAVVICRSLASFQKCVDDLQTKVLALDDTLTHVDLIALQARVDANVNLLDQYRSLHSLLLIHKIEPHDLALSLEDFEVRYYVTIGTAREMLKPKTVPVGGALEGPHNPDANDRRRRGEHACVSACSNQALGGATDRSESRLVSDAAHQSDSPSLDGAVAGITLHETGKRSSKPRDLDSVGSNSDLAHAIRESMRLPTIKLPSFSGKASDWLSFRDLYVAMIHNSDNITAVEKLIHLRASLTGEASSLIVNLPLSNSSYAVAWSTLLDSYDNSSELLRKHLDDIAAIPPLKRESASGLRDLVRRLKSSLHALSALGHAVAPRDARMIHNIRGKLDAQTRREWVLQNKRDCTIDQLLDYLYEKASLLEQLEPSTPNETATKPNPIHKPSSAGKSSTYPSKTHHSFSATVSSAIQCTFCNSTDHLSSKCGKFMNATEAKRVEMLRSCSACYNCLRKGHSSATCRNPHRCHVCKKPHHTLLHSAIEPERSQNPNPSQQSASNTDARVVSCAFTAVGRVSLLPTVKVRLTDTDGKSIVVRALLDSGSQVNLITSSCSSQLQLKYTKANIQVEGVGGHVTKSNQFVEVQVESVHGDYRRTTRFMDVDCVLSIQPATPLDLTGILLPPNVQLADDSFDQPEPIDLIIGGDEFWRSLLPQTIRSSSAPVMFQNTRFGWIVVGRVLPVSKSVCCSVAVVQSLEFDLERFWRLEEVPVSVPKLNPEEQQCEDIFAATTRRDPTGRFVVRLPSVNLPSAEINNSREIAEKRLLQLERRFAKNTNLFEKYAEFLEEYQRLGHMSQIQPTAQMNPFYLPHHPVHRAESTTTKLRVVFDGSCILADGKSLNDRLLRGPVLQEDIISLLLRFRVHKFAVTSDIEKMYRQILVDEADRDKQCILWRKRAADPIQTFQLNTITYGTKTASFLATRCLQAVAQHAAEPVKTVVMRDFYMDDLITGGDNEAELQKLCHQIQDELAQYGLPLRKWRSNCVALTDPEANPTLHLVDKHNAKTLGLMWDAQADNFVHTVDIPVSRTNVVTKRSALSQIARIYDPLGFLAPIVIRGKLFLQQLWLLRADWDSPLPDEQQIYFQEFLHDVQELRAVQIPRRVTASLTFAVHVFVDASESAYCAVAYIRSLSEDTMTVRLLCAKTRLAPLKTRTVPCLELCGAVLGVELAKTIARALDVDVKDFLFWSDSTIVLTWLQTMPHRLKTFVANRVSHLQEATRSAQWRHIRSKQNPADLATRGVNSDLLQKSELWWHGPRFLSLPESEWPEEMIVVPESVPELKVVVATVVPLPASPIQFERFSNFQRLLHATIYVLRFIRSPKVDNKTQLSQSARLTLYRLAQRDEFAKEIAALQAQQPLLKCSAILNLLPFLGEDGLLRIKGRITNKDMSYDERHPVILPSKHRLSLLLFRCIHLQLMHAGPQQIVAHARTHVWVVRAKSLATRVYRQCVTCFRHKPTNHAPMMGNLPIVRTTVAPPFANVGVDFAGPLILQVSHLRAAKSFKGYVAVFVCLVTRAVHLDAVTDLSTDAFLACLRRFISRRGLPSNIYSDNATNFVGTNNEIKRLAALVQNDAVTAETTDKGCKWHFIPPSAPHFGGIWEAAVKSAKHHLRRGLGNARLTYEELATVLCQVEAILNSRPLCAIDDDPANPVVLSPAHFLVGRPLLCVPADCTSASSFRLRYRKLQSHVQEFWEQWRTTYLQSLQRRVKWRENNATLGPKQGQIVTIHKDSAPPQQWDVAMIQELHPGADGVARVATLRMSNGSTLTRPVHKLYPLPYEE